jgi:hypothetical protein
MMRVSVDWISPLNLPFSRTVPLNVYVPSISECSSMYALRSVRRYGGLGRFHHHSMARWSSSGSGRRSERARATVGTVTRKCQSR